MHCAWRKYPKQSRNMWEDEKQQSSADTEGQQQYPIPTARLKNYTIHEDLGTVLRIINSILNAILSYLKTLKARPNRIKLFTVKSTASWG